MRATSQIVTWAFCGLAALPRVAIADVPIAPGTQIINEISLSYEFGGVPVTLERAAKASFVVDRLVDLAVQPLDAGGAGRVAARRACAADICS